MAEESASHLTRRSFLAVSCAGAAAGLAGCGTPESTPESTPTSDRVILGPVEAVPLGGGVIYPAADVVVTQPAPGEYVGFTAVCPHQRCLVGEVSDEGILCRCHGSVFATDDGSVLSGPSMTGLTPVTVRVEDGILILG